MFYGVMTGAREPAAPHYNNLERTRMKMNQKILAISLCVAGLAGAALVTAQGTGIKRTVLTKADVSIENREAVVARAELDPGATVGKHTHAGDEIGYII
jgi:hypothetical protein